MAKFIICDSLQNKMSKRMRKTVSFKSNVKSEKPILSTQQSQQSIKSIQGYLPLLKNLDKGKN